MSSHFEESASHPAVRFPCFYLKRFDTENRQWRVSQLHSLYFSPHETQRSTLSKKSASSLWREYVFSALLSQNKNICFHFFNNVWNTLFLKTYHFQPFKWKFWMSEKNQQSSHQTLLANFLQHIQYTHPNIVFIFPFCFCKMTAEGRRLFKISHSCCYWHQMWLYSDLRFEKGSRLV